MPPRDARGGSAPQLTLPHGDLSAVELTSAIHCGDLDTVRRLLVERPELASVHMIARKGREGGWRTPLHAATDWPGYFPAAPVAVALLLEAGADPNDDSGRQLAAGARRQLSKPPGPTLTVCTPRTQVECS